MNPHSTWALAAAFLLASGAAFALSPLSSDAVLCDGGLRLVHGRCVLDVEAPAGVRRNGFYVNVSGLQRLKLLVNGLAVLDVARDNVPQSSTEAIELTGADRFLKPGPNRIEVESPEPDHRFRMRIWASSMSWYVGNLHAHSRYLDGVHTVHDLLKGAGELGASFYAVTDHNLLRQTYDTAFHRVGGVEPVRGEEWTAATKHANVLGLQSSEPIAVRSVRELIDDATYRGGMVQANHPCDSGTSWDLAALEEPGLDAVEVFNSLTWFRSPLTAAITPLAPLVAGLRLDTIDRVRMAGRRGNADAVALWQALLARGKRIAASGNDDFHGRLPQEKQLNSCTRVFAPSNHPDSILKYWKLGQDMVCATPDGSRMYLYADTNGDGRWDLIAGQGAQIRGKPRNLRFRLEVENAQAMDLLRVWSNHGVTYTHLLPFGGDYAYEWNAGYDSAGRDFVRAELRSAATGVYHCCTNPVYVNYPDYEMGPMRLRATMLPVAANPVGVEETLRFRIANEGGVSPFAFGLSVACDTGLADVVSHQDGGTGVGETSTRTEGSYNVLDWRGGWQWSNRLSAGTSFDCWLVIRPKTRDRIPIRYRSWATDRIFTIAQDPESGVAGPGSGAWKEETAGSNTP